MNIKERIYERNGKKEIYITVRAEERDQYKSDISKVYENIFDIVIKHDATIIFERLFGTKDALEYIDTVRRKFDPSEGSYNLLEVSQGVKGDFAGIQIYAISGVDSIQPIYVHDKISGFFIQDENCDLLTLNNIHDNLTTGSLNKDKSVFDTINNHLANHSIDFRSVVRTWLWLGDILSWYDDFNDIRTDFFNSEKLITKNERFFPASTGIGIRSLNSDRFAVDLISQVNPRKSISYLESAKNQDSAFLYGSAFSRAASIETFVGETLYISGTASIDELGNTTNINNICGQIEDTIDNINSILAISGGNFDVANSIVYCKNQEVEQIFIDKYSDIKWDHLTTIADVCRDDLLFEIELTAISQSK